MVVDFRYHVVTLAAVFLALGIGILVGTAIGGDEALVRQQKHLIDTLERDFTNLARDREELLSKVDVLTVEVERRDEFAAKAVPVLVRGRLSGKRIAVVKTGDAPSEKELNDLVNTLKLAGAEVTSITRITRPFALTEADPISEIASLLKCDLTVGGGAPELASKLAEELVRGTGKASDEGGKPSTFAAALEGMRFLVKSGDYSKGADGVVLLGGRSQGDSTIDGIDAPLIDALRDLGAFVVGAQPSNALVSYISGYRAKGITTVDNIDTPYGKAALVWGLLGAKGSFGVGKDVKFAPDFAKLESGGGK